jgi:hypothetical protein
MGVSALGRLFNVGSQIVPVDLGTAANTGHRVYLRDYEGVAFVYYTAIGTAAEAPTITLQEHTASTGGTSTNLVNITKWHEKTEAVLDGDESWTLVTQVAAATATDATWDDAKQVLMIFEVQGDSLTDGYEWVSCNIADTGTAHLGCMLAITYGLKAARTPANLPSMTGVANA